jgi:hypothetical protein
MVTLNGRAGFIDPSNTVPFTVCFLSSEDKDKQVGFGNGG